MSGDPGSEDDAQLAREIAAEAGQRLLALRARYSGGREPGADGAAHAGTPTLRDAADRLAHEYLTAELARRRPGDAVLSEEGAPATGQPDRLTADRVWIVDPLDGTREFGEPWRTDWAVHVALWQRDHPGGTQAARTGQLTAGAVALPAQGMTLSTIGPAPAGAAGAAGSGAAAGAPPRPLRIVVSRSRPPAFAEKLSGLVGGAGAGLVPLGSAGAKTAAVLAGDADAYVHDGGFYEWDTAAPAAVARAAGFHASRLDGRPLLFNQDNVWMPDILICPAALAGTLLDAVGVARAAGAGDVPGHA